MWGMSRPFHVPGAGLWGQPETSFAPGDGMWGMSRSFQLVLRAPSDKARPKTDTRVAFFGRDGRLLAS